MKLITKLLLINWHYFVHETISFGQLNFLTGKNASGKSTVIDAMQTVLYGDTSGSFFNKAANGKGNRTLMGYLRGELGDAEDSGFRYLRNGRFTSYIAFEFYDDVKRKYLTAGCCFDVYSENDMQKKFFCYDGKFPENEFISNGIPLDIKTLCSGLKSDYAGHYHTTDSGREFRSELYAKLGSLREQFCRLMKKAVSFNPNVDIQQFISEFVCNTQQSIDISQMQENIRSYKKLEEEADILRRRIELLEEIADSFNIFKKNEQDFMMYSYLLDKADVDICTDKLLNERNKAQRLKEEISILEKVIREEKENIRKMQEERDHLNIQLGSDKHMQEINYYEKTIADKKDELERLNEEYSKAEAILSQSISGWIENIYEIISILSDNTICLNNPALQSRIEDIREESSNLLKAIRPMNDLNAEKIEDIGEENFLRYREEVIGFYNNSMQMLGSLTEEHDRLLTERNKLKNEKDKLKKGIYDFPKDAVDLKEAIISKLRLTTKENVPVVIVAEAAEIRGKRWRNTIEGYLHTQKFYIIVPKQYYLTASKVYDTIKRKKSIYATGLVDIEKLAEKNPHADKGSLAEEIFTDNPDVRMFLDYTLGRVMKCDGVEKLRNHRIAVTDEGMLYRNFVLSAINPNRWAKPAIGQSAIKDRLIDVENEIKQFNLLIDNCLTIKNALNKTKKLSWFSKEEAEQSVLAAISMKKVPRIKQDIEKLTESRDAVDKSTFIMLKNHISSLNNDIGNMENKRTDNIEKISSDKERYRICMEESIPGYEKELDEKQQKLFADYESSWVEEEASVRYSRELHLRGSALNISVAFPRERSRASNKKDEAWQKVLNFRQEYNNIYKMGYDINIRDNELYKNIWHELSENKLRDYITRIRDTKNKAFEQFREDFLSRLQHNIDDAVSQINDLNMALKGHSFGEDRYRFSIIPKPEYKRYYDMIMDPMKLDGGYNLFSEQFNAKYKNEIEDLFAIITNENSVSVSRSNEDYEKRVRMFTDYRTYLSFDLEVIDKDGDTQRLSRTIGKKSGGETQTPFYIAVLASFAQLYRLGRDKTGNTLRLIIFDEAFSKMDGERISKSVELLKRFGFQAVLSAPPDKIGDIAPYMDSTICVWRDGKKAWIRNFDFPGVINYE